MHNYILSRAVIKQAYVCWALSLENYKLTSIKKSYFLVKKLNF